VLARCADLGPGALEVLRLAAVLGHQVSAAELGWCLAEPDGSDDHPGSDRASTGDSPDTGAAQGPDLTADHARRGGLAGQGVHVIHPQLKPKTHLILSWEQVARKK